MEEDSNEELYAAFCRSLSKPVGERFFDEDELVDIFDYAGDRGDEYVRMEVLFCGARLYPESEKLAERRAILYSTLDETDSLTKYLSDNPSRQSMIWDLIRLASQVDDKAKIEEALEYIFAQYDDFSDEEIIWLIKIAKENDCYDWLKASAGRIRSKISYMPTFLYDMSIAAEENSDLDTEIKCLEELVEIEPFSDAYWAILVRAYSKAGREDDARQAFDYAKALASDNDAAAMYLVESALMYAPYLIKDTLEVLAGFVANSPDEFKYVESMSALYLAAQNRKFAVDTLRSFFDRHPDNADCLVRLLSLNVKDPKELISRHYEVCGPDALEVESLVELSTTLLGLNALDALKALVDVVLENTPQLFPAFASAYAEALFAKGLYEDCFTVLSAMPDPVETFSNIFTDVGPVMLYLMCAVKTGRKEEALAFADKVRPLFEGIMKGTPVAMRALGYAVLKLIAEIRRLYDSNVAPSLAKDYFDPLKYSKFS